MAYREPRRRSTRPNHTILVAGLLVAIAAVAASVLDPLLSSASPTVTSSPPAASSPPGSSSSAGGSPRSGGSPSRPVRNGQPGAPGEVDGAGPASATVRPSPRARALGEFDGVVPDGVTVFDSGYPAVSKLDPALLRTLRRAASDAAGDGVTVFINSGWRSRAYQEQLFRQAVSEYGSEAKAAHRVAPPGTSAHETGNAVDLGQAEARTWLLAHGAHYGLCQVYRNEPWHYELRPEAVDHGCPPMYADPTDDPRMPQ